MHDLATLTSGADVRLVRVEDVHCWKFLYVCPCNTLYAVIISSMVVVFSSSFERQGSRRWKKVWSMHLKASKLNEKFDPSAREIGSRLSPVCIQTLTKENRECICIYFFDFQIRKKPKMCCMVARILIFF
jgi:hypothetical protein